MNLFFGESRTNACEEIRGLAGRPAKKIRNFAGVCLRAKSRDGLQGTAALSIGAI